MQTVKLLRPLHHLSFEFNQSQKLSEDRDFSNRVQLQSLSTSQTTALFFNSDTYIIVFEAFTIPKNLGLLLKKTPNPKI